MKSGEVPRNRAAAGFTLLEVIVALTILAAGILGISELMGSSLRLSGGARDVSTATVYASQRMEEALLSPSPAEGEESGRFGERYRWILRTSFPASGKEENAFRPVRFEVSIRWDDGEGERSVDLVATRWDPRRSGAGAGG